MSLENGLNYLRKINDIHIRSQCNEENVMTIKDNLGGCVYYVGSNVFKKSIVEFGNLFNKWNNNKML